MVGFNRRFSPHTIKIKELLAGRADPLCMNMTINGGKIPEDHWTQDPVRGGGRIIGEGCHFIDLLSYIADAPVVTVSAIMMGDVPAIRSDKMSIVLGFGDGSVGTVNYFSNGSKAYPKETLEIFSDNRVLRTENFRVTRGYGFKGFKKFKTLRQDKGHKTEMAVFIDRISNGGEALIPFERVVNSTEASFAAMESAQKKQTIVL
jgi:predicted dehydrogenase